MRPQIVLFYAIVFILKLTSCLKTGADQPQLDKSGWRTIEFSSESLANEPDIREDSLPHVKRNSSRSSKLIEWDDEDLNDLQSSKDASYLFPQWKSVRNSASNQRKNTNHKHRRGTNKFSRLIYHGQVKGNESMRVVDGIKLHIDTHQPLAINRRSSSNRFLPTIHAFEEAQEEPTVLNSRWSGSVLSGGLRDESSKQLADQQSSSDWKPLVVGPRIRRTGKTKKTLHIGNLIETKQPRALNESFTLDYNWKPIETKLTESIRKIAKERNMVVGLGLEVGKESVIYGKKTVEAPRQLTPSSIGQPFDDDGIIVANISPDESTNESRGQKRTEYVLSRESPVKRQLDNRWTPVDTTTVSNFETTTDFHSVVPSSALTATAANQSESAQKSASDLNYIYSSQPVAGQSELLANGRQSASGYYSNIVVQPQQSGPLVEQPQQQLTGAIIDTTSGQTPEMIMDRSPELPPGETFSISQLNANFQPVQGSQVNRASFNYDNSNYYTPTRQLTSNQSPQPIRQAQTTAPSGQVVRQEHHYHYYNQQQAERQTQPSNQVSVIREVQPLIISQPLVQQQSTTTTTPAPQIIREIIKEVPVQTMPVEIPRIIVPQTISVQQTRDLEPNSGYGSYAPAVPAQRIIRQISNGMQTLRVPQMPVVPQIRLPLPSLQLPVRLAQNQAPVTRQTGSFVIPPMPKKTTTYLTETQAVPTHTTIMHTTQFTPATRTTVYTTDHQAPPTVAAASAFRRRRR